MIGTIIFCGVVFVILGLMAVASARICTSDSYQKQEADKARREQDLFWSHRL